LGNKQWIWRAMSEWDNAHDLECKKIVSNCLRHELHIYTVIDQTIFIHKKSGNWQVEHPQGYTTKGELLVDWDVHMPDLFALMTGLAIEIDGDWHFNTAKGRKQTNKRNEHYDYAKIKLVWLTPKEIADCENDEKLAGLILGLMDHPHTYFVP